MDAMASQITSLTIVYSTVYSGADKRIHQSSASLAFVRGIHRGPANSPHKWPVTRKMFPFHDVIMRSLTFYSLLSFNVILSQIDSSAQDCGNSSADALELVQSCAKPSIYYHTRWLRLPSLTRHGVELHIVLHHEISVGQLTGGPARLDNEQSWLMGILLFVWHMWKYDCPMVLRRAFKTDPRANRTC